MSLHVSAATTLELPARLWGDRAADGVGLLAAGAVAWVGSRYGSAVIAVALGILTAAVLWRAGRGTTAGGTAEVLPGAATRRLGATLVIQGRWHATGLTLGPVWLTSGDLPTDRLRQAWVHLRAARRKTGS
jgi:hypothetical protein